MRHSQLTKEQFEQDCTFASADIIKAESARQMTMLKMNLTLCCHIRPSTDRQACRSGWLNITEF